MCPTVHRSMHRILSLALSLSPCLVRCLDLLHRHCPIVPALYSTPERRSCCCDFSCIRLIARSEVFFCVGTEAPLATTLFLVLLTTLFSSFRLSNSIMLPPFSEHVSPCKVERPLFIIHVTPVVGSGRVCRVCAARLGLVWFGLGCFCVAVAFLHAFWTWVEVDWMLWRELVLNLRCFGPL